MCIISKIQRRLSSKTQPTLANMNKPKEGCETKNNSRAVMPCGGKGTVVDKPEEKNVIMNVLITLAT